MKQLIQHFLCLIIVMMAAPVVGMNANDRYVLVIDAGHGGRDAGAMGAFSKEKDINLNVALAFGRYVENNCPDVKVIYTRKTDVFIPLMERANIANKNKADLFVSIHTNALPGGKQAYGLETYTLGMHRAGDNLDVAKRENAVILIEKDYKQRYEGFDPNSSESYIMFELMQDKNMANSVDMAKMVQNEVCKLAGRPDKGVHQAGFLVLRETSMPSCLIELGFITTPSEEQLLNNAESIDKIAKGIYLAFVRYKDKYNRRVVIPYKPSETTEVPVASVIPDVQNNSSTTTKSQRRNRKDNKREVKLAKDAAQTTNKVSDTPANTSKEDEDSTREFSQIAAKQEVTAAEKNNIERLRDAKKAVTKEQEQQNKPSQKQEQRVIKNSQTDKTADNMPVYKLQILTTTDTQRAYKVTLKDVENVSCYQDGNVYKFTCGASTDYHTIIALKKKYAERFPDAFVVAFIDGKRVGLAEARKYSKTHR